MSDRQTAQDIWDAVETAIFSGWGVDRFRRECAEAWAEAMRRNAEADAEMWKVKP